MACPLVSATENHSWLVLEGRFLADGCKPHSSVGKWIWAEGRCLIRVGAFLLHSPESWVSFWEPRHGTSCSHQYLGADLATGVLLPCCSRVWQAWWKLALPPVSSQMQFLEDDIHCHQVFTSHSGGAMSSRHLSS